MTAVLVSVEELRSYVGATTGDLDQLQQILDGLEASLVRAVHRVKYPWARVQAGLVEVHAGTGSTKLWLGYPIAAVTTVTLGRDPNNPDLTLDPADFDELVFGVGTNLLERSDGGTFGRKRSPRYVHITYDAQEDRPLEAQRALLTAAAGAWQRKGTEAYSKVSELGASVTFAGAGQPGGAVNSPGWDPDLVAQLRRFAP